jgi:hypothetical protein
MDIFMNSLKLTLSLAPIVAEKDISRLGSGIKPSLSAGLLKSESE